MLLYVLTQRNVRRQIRFSCNVHEHQIEFMQKFEEQGGIAFLLIYYTTRMSYTICGTGKYKNFGIVRKTAAEKYSI